MKEIDLGFRPYLDGYYDASIQLQMHVYRRSEALFQHFDRVKDAIDTPEKALAWQAQIRKQAPATFGGLPDTQTPLEPERIGTVRGTGFDIEKLIFQSMPRVYVTANLYLPHALNGRTGAVLFVCGHSEQAKGWPEYQAVCQRLVRSGLIVLAIDPFGQGERKGYLDENGHEIVKWGPIEHTFAGFQCWWLGQSSARYFVHDARRAIDYLVSRPEVDPSRIGMTGNSGGGTQTAWTMLVEDRLAAAAPATFITRRRDYLWSGRPQDAEQHLLGGTTVGIDHEDCLIALAPKPVLVLAADYDYFNVEGAVAAVERARQFYRLLGKPDNVNLVRTSGTHAYHPALAKAATEFFAKHLLDDEPSAVIHHEPELFDPDTLLCTRSGQILIDRPETRRIFDLNLAEYRRRPTRSREPAPRAEQARRWLEEVVHRHRRPGPLYPRWLPGPEVEGFQVSHGLWWSEVDVLGAGCLLRPSNGEYSSLLIALFDRGTAEIDEQRAWLTERIAAGQAVLVLDVRGSGALAPHEVRLAAPEGFGGTLHKFMADLLWLSDSLAAMQIFDVICSVELLQHDPEMALDERPLHLYGAGRALYRAALTAALTPAIRRVELSAPPLDLESLVGQRLYLGSPHWQEQLPEMLIPGLAANVDWSDLTTLLEDREVQIHHDR